MGIIFDYLKKPVTEKNSTNEENGKLNCGTSTMQGWRISQEDAHNSILDYDKNTSYFAVYDGHGGRAVAIYSSQELPKFLKELDEYKNGNFQKALEEAFLKFDATIATDEVIAKLKEISKEDDKIDTESDEDDENINNLYEEAEMPLDKVIEKYTSSNPDLKSYLKSRNILHDLKSSGDNLPNSSTTNASCASENNSEAVSSPSSNITSSKLNDDGKSEKQSDSSDTHKACAPSSNDTTKEALDQNGVKSKENCELSNTDGITSTAPQENGDTTKEGKDASLSTTKDEETKPPFLLRPKRTVKQIYNALMAQVEGSEDESEDEKDETFEDSSDDSSDENDAEAVPKVRDVSSSSIEEEGDEEEDDEEEGEEEEEEEDYGKCGNYEEMTHPMDCGCTAVVALLRENDLYVANAGDSRCVVCRSGQAIEMSFDHKPDDKIEKTRIKKAGGYVSSDGRVNDGLNLSRAIGDHGYKQNKKLSDREQMITALPDIKTLTINPDEDEFMVLACDGIWNSLSSQEVVDFVRPKIQEGKLTLAQICEEMFDHCLAPKMSGDGTGCDNMTAIIVQFKSNTKKRSASLEPEEVNQQKKSKTEEETKKDVAECT